jgi:hypothetical protein
MRVEERVFVAFDFCRFVFMTLQNVFPTTPFFSQPSEMPRGVGALFRRERNRNAKSAKPLSPFNVVFRRSMHGNTV